MGPPGAVAGRPARRRPALGAALDDRSDGVQAVASVAAWGVWVVVPRRPPGPPGHQPHRGPRRRPRRPRGGGVGGRVRRAATTRSARSVVAVRGRVARHRAPPSPPRWATCSSTGRPTGPSGASPCGARRRWPPSPSSRGSRWPPARSPVPLLLGARAVGRSARWRPSSARSWWSPGGRSLHGLARRWLVFVPSGLVVHDPVARPESVMAPRPLIVGLEPAREGADGVDLTVGAPGLVLELVDVGADPGDGAPSGRRAA